MNHFIHPHIAITVNNIEKTKIFYSNIGFKVVIENFSLEKSRYFMLLSGYDFQIEVFQFVDQIPNQKIENDLKMIGLQHIAFRVEDLSKMKDKLLENNIILDKDISISSLGIKFINILDPDGLIIEFFE
jgi:catechol 2,3-dioxygenase-like lactoylglutathione lyase family enzyme